MQKPLLSSRWLIICGIALVIASVCEGMLFNHFYFRYHLGKYQEHNIQLPFHEQLNRHAVVLDDQHNTFSISKVDLPLFCVGIETLGYQDFIEAYVHMTDDSSLVNPIVANHKTIAPYGKSEDVQLEKIFVLSNGLAHDVFLRFDGIKYKQLVITKVVINPEPVFGFNISRFVLILLCLVGLGSILCFKLYQYRLSEISPRAFKLANTLSILCCVSMTLVVFNIFNPHHVSPTLTFDYTEKGFFHIGTPKQTWFLDYPTTKQQIEFFDPYVKTLDALNKGQLNLDVEVDPKLNTLPTPYDPGVRKQNNAEGFWDHSFYKGKYYSYYGYGPVFSWYYPIYWLTGKIPSIAFSLVCLTLGFIVSMYAAMYATLRFFKVNANALLFFTAECGMVWGCHTYFIQAFNQFYSFAVLISSIYLCLLTIATYSLPMINKSWLRRCALCLIGISVVMIVLSRPLNLLFACIVTLPVLIPMVLRTSYKTQQDNVQPQATPNTSTQEKDSPQAITSQVAQASNTVAYKAKDKILDFMAIGIPTLIGAIFTMVTNYLRFDSIFEFGQKYCTGLENFLYNKLYFSLDNLASTLHLFVFRGYNQFKEFPYFRISNNANMVDFGNFQYGDFHIGLFSSPLWLCIFLVFILFSKRKQGNELPNNMDSDDSINSSQASQTKYWQLGLSTLFNRNNLFSVDTSKVAQITMTCLIVAVLCLFYVQFQVAAYTVRYTFEDMVPLLPLSLMLLCQFIYYKHDMVTQGKLIYWLTLGVVFYTMLLECFGVFSLIEQAFSFVNPHIWLEAEKFFSPFSTIY